MLFNSHEFLFVFLPATLVGFFLLGRVSRQAAILWLILASLLFYGWWRPLNILIIAPSIIINYLLASLPAAAEPDGATSRGLSRAVLLLGILFNVAFLGFFKYANFVTGTINDVFGANFVLLHIILPLGISFITFQKIAFLIDVHAGRVKAFTFRDYCLFVLFFPQLIAGPIVHYREMMPQFAAATCRFDKENFAVGLTLFVLRPVQEGGARRQYRAPVTPIYEHSAAGGHIAAADRLDGGGRLHAADLFRLLRLYRHGARARPVLRHQAAAQLQLAAQGVEHHRLLAELAHDADAVPDRVHLQSVGAVADEAQAGPRAPRIRRAQSASRRLRFAADGSPDHDHVHFRALARGRLWIRHLGPDQRRLSRRQSRLARLCRASVSGPRGLRPRHEARRFRRDFCRLHPVDDLFPRNDGALGDRSPHGRIGAARPGATTAPRRSPPPTGRISGTR